MEEDEGESGERPRKRKREEAKEEEEEEEELVEDAESASHSSRRSGTFEAGHEMDRMENFEDQEVSVLQEASAAVASLAVAVAAQDGRTEQGYPRHAGSLSRRLANMLRGEVRLQVQVEGEAEESGEDSFLDDFDFGTDYDEGEEEALDVDDLMDNNVVVLGAGNFDSQSGTESHCGVDIANFREKLAIFSQESLDLWKSSAFTGSSRLTGECAIAVAQWVEQEQITAAEIQNEMLSCMLRCLESGLAMLEVEEDLAYVFVTVVALTEHPDCLNRLLERGALESMVHGLQGSANLLLLDEREDADWGGSEQLVQVNRAFKTLWQVCCAKPADDVKRLSITELLWDALQKWLHGVPLQDIWIGEDNILVFWALIPLWPHYLDHLEAKQATEEKGRFQEICNWVLWPNDPLIESSYGLIGNLDIEDGEDISLKFLFSEKRFQWVITPATKQRYLQYRVGKVAEAQAEVEDPNGEHPGLLLVINRESPLQDLCQQLGISGYTPCPINLIGGISVHFHGVDGAAEDGIDEGGPWREAIPLMLAELTSLKHGLFQLREDGEIRTVEPLWCAANLVPDYQAQYELCGMLIGMALVYQAYAPAHFSRCFLKHLLGQKRSIDDVPALADQMKQVRAAGDTLEMLCLTFSVDDSMTGQTAELTLGGADKEVTSKNVDSYLQMRSNWEVEKRFEHAMPYVLKGLHCIVPPDVLEAFSQIVSPEELDVLLAGNGINITDWQEYTEYSGFEEDPIIIQWFWEIVEGFTAQEREDLWTFISGSKGVPPGGFGNLTNADGEGVRFTIQNAYSSPDHLPVAHTCSYQLDLPAYETAEALAMKLRLAMAHHQGFGLA